MRSRWFHRPLLHTAHGEERKVSWLELFYDLIFVAAIIQLGDALSRDVRLGTFVAFAGHFVPLWVAWSGFTFYMNRFHVDDMLHRTLIFLKMFGVGAMAIAAPEAMNGEPTAFAITFGLVQLLIAILHARTWRQVPAARPYCRYWGSVFTLSAVCWLLSPLLPTPYNYSLWVLGTAAIFFAPVHRRSRELTDQYPIDFEHLAERYGLLTIIVLGESFVKVLSFLTAQDHGFNAEYLAKGSLNLLITCCIWWIYFDDIAGAHIRKGRGAWIVWLYGHVPSTIAITAVGVAVKKAVKFEFAAPAPDAYRWLLSGALALTLISVAIIDSVTERRNAELSDRARVNVRAASAILVLLLGQVGGAMSSATFLVLITAVCLAQVLFDMMMVPMEEAQLEGSAPVSTADIARMNATERTKIARPRPDQAVRKGTPSELRRDLYFFFMEGSWARLILSLSFAYLILNVFFAGLYLIGPSSIGGGAEPDSFADAFFFSVQTMSTVGYGGMTPATSYGNLIVTLEAAVGLLAVAVATGLIFAKVSRPQSSVLFSKPLVVTTMHGKRVLSFRAGNARGNEVVDATMTVTVLIDEVSAEGHHMRRLHDMDLMRANSPMFVMSWAVIHEIDDDSPVADVDWEHPEDKIIGIIATMIGHDGTYGQTTFARHIYDAEDIRVDHRFVDVMSQLDDGRLMIDYTRFHDTIADEAASSERDG